VVSVHACCASVRWFCSHHCLWLSFKKLLLWWECFLCRLLFQKVKYCGLGQWFSTWGSFAFFLGSRELLINILIITSTFWISYIGPLFVVVKIIELPGSSAVNKFVRGRPVNDVVLSSTVTSVYFPKAENWYKAPAKTWAILFQGGHGFFGLILAALLLPGKNDSLLFHSKLF